jgi:hypothetical protein
MNIRVEYDGAWPSVCVGRLQIFVNDEEVYNESYRCFSTGSVWFDENWDEHVECGELLWEKEDASQFSEVIQEAVRQKLAEFHVCCGGCV